MQDKAQNKPRQRLTIRVELDTGAKIGPGKIALLEAIGEAGSISGAGRLLKMSYKRAWDLIEELNHAFAEPVIATSTGGSHGGGAQLTPAGKKIIAHFREVERTALAAAQPELAALEIMARPKEG